MPSLLDTVSNNAAALAGQQAAPSNQAGQIQALLAAKSGKAIAPSEIAASNLGEQQANVGTTAALSQQGQQIVQQNLGQQQQAQQASQQYGLQRAQLAQTGVAQEAQQRQKVNQLLANVAQQKGQLSLQQQKDQLEQASFLIGMQDKQYTTRLQQIGQQQQLSNSVGFENTLQQVAFGNQLSFLQQSLGQEDVLQAGNRDLNAVLSSMSIDQAMQVAQQEQAAAAKSANMQMQQQQYMAQLGGKAASGAAQAQALGGFLSAGVQGAGAYANYQDRQTQANTGLQSAPIAPALGTDTTAYGSGPVGGGSQ